MVEGHGHWRQRQWVLPLQVLCGGLQASRVVKNYSVLDDEVPLFISYLEREAAEEQ